MISKIDEILDFLASDGDIHSLKETSVSLDVSLNVCKDIVSFLNKYDFVKLKGKNLKINPKIRGLVLKTSHKPLLQVTPSQ